MANRKNGRVRLTVPEGGRRAMELFSASGGVPAHSDSITLQCISISIMHLASGSTNFDRQFQRSQNQARVLEWKTQILLSDGSRTTRTGLGISPYIERDADKPQTRA